MILENVNALLSGKRAMRAMWLYILKVGSSMCFTLVCKFFAARSSAEEALWCDGV